MRDTMSDRLWHVVGGLDMDTQYEVFIVAYTRNSDGDASPRQMGKTDGAGLCILYSSSLVLLHTPTHSTQFQVNQS